MISDLVKDSYKGFTVAPFNRSELAKRPLTLIGALRSRQFPRCCRGTCRRLLDLSRTDRSQDRQDRLEGQCARLGGRGGHDARRCSSRNRRSGSRDEATTAYVKSCQASKIGDTPSSDYTDRVGVASVIGDAIDAYDAKRYSDAADLLRTAVGSPGGDQLRAYDGFYLANWRLNREEEAKQAFIGLVDHGLTTSNGAS